MKKHNEKNERIKRRYAQYLTASRRQSETSVDKALAAINRFEEVNRRRDFMAFHVEQAIAFRERLAEELNSRTGRPLSKGTVTATLKALRAFFLWRGASIPKDRVANVTSGASTWMNNCAITRPMPTMISVVPVINRISCGRFIEPPKWALGGNSIHISAG